MSDATGMLIQKQGMPLQIVWITSRSGPNDNHRKYMESIGADHQFVDFRLRWQDVHAPRWKRYLSWIICALTFPNRSRYQMFITGGEQFPAVLMKKFGRIGKKQLVICLHATETLYFLKAGRYPKFTTKALEWLIPQFDAHIAISEMEAALLRDIKNVRTERIYTVYNGVPIHRMPVFEKVQPDLSGKNICFIGKLYAGWRLWYKGVDLMLEVLSTVLEREPKITFTIIGEVEPQAMKELEQSFPKTLLDRVNFVGRTRNLEQYFAQSALYLHCARGEAFGISVVEAMAAGVPTIISEWTGAKEAVEQVSKDLVLPLDADLIAHKILWYFNLPLADKKELSEKSRSVAKDYTQEKAIWHFQNTIRQIAEDFNIV